MQRRLSEIAGAIGARVINEERLEITGVASIASADRSDLVFVEDEKHLASALESKTAAVIAGTFAENNNSSKPLLIAANPRLAFARAARLLHRVDRPTAGIHPAAVVHSSADLGEGVDIDARAIVHEDAVVGDRTWIGAGAVIGKAANIGDDCE